MSNEQATRRFYELAWPHRAAVLRVAQILAGGSTADAEDLAQETMLKAFRSIDQFRSGTDARAWLLAILRNTRIDRLRAGGSAAGTVSLDHLASDPPAPPDADGPAGHHDPVWESPEEVLNEFGDREVIDALRRLPEEIRWTLLLVDVEGIDHAEAARILGVPTGTIKSRTHRGRAMLRDALLPLARDRRLVRD